MKEIARRNYIWRLMIHILGQALIFILNVKYVIKDFTNTPSRQIKVHLCDKEVQQDIHLITDMGTHTDGNLYKCKHCGKQFSTNSGLITHKRTHIGEYVNIVINTSTQIVF